ncbi:MAG: PQQ-binding-like beta-propeller repeat protein [Acidobacteriota bacterium]
MKRRFLQAAFLLLLTTSSFDGADWPEWRGPGRKGVWIEDGVLDAFPAKGLKIRWRTPVGSGYSGPAVAAGRVFVTDFIRREGNRGLERVLCLSEKDGVSLWMREWEVDYVGLMGTYATGPRATPTVDGELLYVLGAKGKLLCLRTDTGAIVWQKEFQEDYRTQVPVWGITGAPLVEGDNLVCLVGGQPDAKVVAFNKRTGKEVWRALSSDSEPGYAPPIAVSIAARKQIVIWHPQAVSALDPETGQVLWEAPFQVHMGLSVATPVQIGDRLLVSSFYNGSLLLKLGNRKPDAQLVWKGKSQSEISSDGLHALISTPVVHEDFIYGFCSYGQFRCLKLQTGERVWESLELTREKARWASGFLVRHGERFFINNDRGELILARLSPSGFHQLDRTTLIRPTTNSGNRRELGAVNWSHPAYANRHVFARNDEELLCASLEKE